MHFPKKLAYLPTPHPTLFPNFLASLFTMMRKLLLWMLVLGLHGVVAKAQDSLPTQWSLQQCVDYALKENLQLRLSGQAIRRSEVTLMQARAQYLPNLNGSAGYNFNFGRNIDPFTNQFINQTVRSTTFGLTSNVPLFAGGQIRNGVKQAEINLEAATFDVQRAKNDLMLQVVQAYLQVVLNQEILKSAKLQIKSTEEQLSQTEKLIKAGALAEINIYDIRAQLATDEQRIVQAENSLMVSKLALRQLLQLPADAPITLDVPELAAPSAKDQLTTAGAVYEVAESAMPEVRAADLNKEAADLGVDIAKGGKLPTLSLAGSAFTNYSSAQSQFFEGDGTTALVNVPIGFLQDDPSQIVVTPREVPNGEIVDFGFTRQLRESLRMQVGLSLQIPIFNRFQAEGQVQNAKINYQQAKLNAEVTRNQLRQTIEQAWTDARAAQATYSSTEKRVQALKMAYEASEKRYKAGALNAAEFNIAKNNFNAAELDLIQAKFQYLFALKVLDFYEGKEINLD